MLIKKLLSKIFMEENKLQDANSTVFYRKIKNLDFLSIFIGIKNNL